MKIKVTDLSYEEVCKLPVQQHVPPVKPNLFWRTVLKAASVPELHKVDFSCDTVGMEKLGKEEPALFLMNHSSFIDLKIAASILYPRPFNIICTSDGFVGKEWFMRSIGCIPTRKFVNETTLVRDMLYTLRELRSSILMYPEASYSFDGTATPIPESLGKCLKLLHVPVVMIRTYGAYARDPLYNSLQLRNVPVTAKMEYLLSPEEINNRTVKELNDILAEQFCFDNFSWQKENNVQITEPFRADGLNRVLYRCPVCGTEGETEGKGTTFTCRHCHETWQLTELGQLVSENSEATKGFSHIPDWYRWERECVKRELLDGTYSLDIPVDIYMLVDMKSVYRVGSGRLQHSVEGFKLTGCDGKLEYRQTPSGSYSLYSDFYWYEIGDMICIGDTQALYYCFPTDGSNVVAKTRLAAEELYKLKKSQRDKK